MSNVTIVSYTVPINLSEAFKQVLDETEVSWTRRTMFDHSDGEPLKEVHVYRVNFSNVEDDSHFCDLCNVFNKVINIFKELKGEN